MARKLTTDEQRRVDALVDYLFVNGVGERGVRLAIIDADDRDLGSWGRLAVREAVIKFVLRDGAEGEGE